MKKLVVLFFSVVIILGVTNEVSAQSQDKESITPITIRQTPTPRRTNVQYAPGKEPSLSQQITTIERKVKQLKTIPKTKQSKHTKDRIVRLEKELKAKRKEKKRQTNQ